MPPGANPDDWTLVTKGGPIPPPAPRFQALCRVVRGAPYQIASPASGSARADILRVNVSGIPSSENVRLLPGPVRRAPLPAPGLLLPDPGVTCPKSLMRIAPLSVPPHRDTEISPVRLSAKAHPRVESLSPPPLSFPVSRGMQISRADAKRAAYPSLNTEVVAAWKDILEQIGDESALYSKLQGSLHRDQHLARILDGFAPSTLLQYFTAIRSFFRTCSDLHVQLPELTDVILADVLMTIALARKSDSAGVTCACTIKAVRWLCKHADVAALNCVSSPVVSSFMKISRPRDRREAPPIPLCLAVYWERRLLQHACSDVEALVLGFFLFLLWSGLRFADAQRVRPKSLMFDGDQLRGVCWRSKTNSSGQPFGLVARGFLSVGRHNWVWRFLRALDVAYAAHPDQELDFLMPHLSGSGVISPLTPLSYASGIRLLRYYFQCPWETSTPLDPDLAKNFTIHSLKATPLSWASQKGLSPEDRLQQGHHAGGQHSLRLYSRDDVNGAIRIQSELIRTIRSGWRPMAPQHRGGQLPMVEPPVTVETFSKAANPEPFLWFQFSQRQAVVDPDVSQEDVEEASDSSSSDSASTSSSEEDSGPRVGEPTQEALHLASVFEADEAIFGRFRDAIHAMIKAPLEETWRPQVLGISMKPACGKPMRAGGMEFVNRLPAGANFCQHKACRKVWQSWA